MAVHLATRASLRRSLSSAVVLAALAGCSDPEPLYFTDFMEDRFAREGTLARCNENRDASVNDIECANARRAAAAIALREERARRAELEQESERRISELRAEVERQRQVALEAQALAEEAARSAYEAQWREGQGVAPPVGVDGEPLATPGRGAPNAADVIQPPQ